MNHRESCWSTYAELARTYSDIANFHSEISSWVDSNKYRRTGILNIRRDRPNCVAEWPSRISGVATSAVGWMICVVEGASATSPEA